MLKNKTVVVTGGSGGIGKAIAVEMAARRANIVLLYASGKESAEETCRQCAQAFGVTAVALACDISDYETARRVVADILQSFGSIHVLVNNAGITRDRLAMLMKEEDFSDVVDVNLKGAFHMTRHVLPAMVKGREGCIINISSISGLVGNRGQSNYAASKAGLIGFTKSIAKEYASRSIRCNAVAPGFIRTKMTEGLKEADICRQIPLGRMGTPQEVAGAVAYLAEAAYVTGEVLRVDGGAAM